MAQQRLWNFGDTITHTKLITSYQVLFDQGVYSGYDISLVDQSTIEVSSGYLLLPDGIILHETDSFRITLIVAPAVATTYTIVVTHEDANLIGGTGAVFNLQTGFFAEGSVPNGVVIGWIYHPGSAAAFESWMFVQPPKRKVDEFVANLKTPVKWSAPFPTAIMEPNVSHTISTPRDTLPGLQTGTQWPRLRIFAEPTTAGTPATTLIFPVVTVNKPSRIDLVYRLANSGMTLNARVYDTTETLATISPAGFSFVDTDWKRVSIQVPLSLSPTAANGTWTAGEQWRLELDFLEPHTTTGELLSVEVFYDPTL